MHLNVRNCENCLTEQPHTVRRWVRLGGRSGLDRLGLPDYARLSVRLDVECGFPRGSETAERVLWTGLQHEWVVVAVIVLIVVIGCYQCYYSGVVHCVVYGCVATCWYMWHFFTLQNIWTVSVYFSLHPLSPSQSAVPLVTTPSPRPTRRTARDRIRPSRVIRLIWILMNGVSSWLCVVFVRGNVVWVSESSYNSVDNTLFYIYFSFS